MLGQIATMILQFIGAILMARLLTPDDYGLVAMVTVLMGVGALIRDFGMGTAALQERTLSQAQASNLFWVNAALSGGTAVVLAVSTPLVVQMFGDERLAALVPIMALVLLTTGLQTQYQARLARQMRFLAVALTSVTSVLVGIVVGVLTAAAGWGYWALAAQQGASALAMLVALLALTRWVPSRPTRSAGSRAHIVSGAHYGLANVLGYAADNVDTLMIGIHWGSIALGNYNRAFQLFMQPITAIFAPLTRVVIPTINKSALEGHDPNTMLLRVQSALVGLATLGLVVSAAVADWLIPLLLGEQWVSIVRILQILALGGIFKALSQINYWAYVVARQSRQLLYSNLVTKPIQILLVVLASFLGVESVAWAYVLGRAISWPINLVWLRRTAGQPSGAAFVNGLRIIVAAAIGYMAARLASASLPDLPDAPMVTVVAFVAILTYVVVFVGFPGGWQEAKRIVSLRDVLRRHPRS